MRRSERKLVLAVVVSLVAGMLSLLLVVLTRLRPYTVGLALVGVVAGQIGHQTFRRNSAHYSRQYQLLCWVAIGLNILALAFELISFFALAGVY